jgi:hypothetical protein
MEGRNNPKKMKGMLKNGQTSKAGGVKKWYHGGKEIVLENPQSRS